MPEVVPLPLDPKAVRLDATASSRDDAIRQCGEMLLSVGAIEAPYIDTMLERERSISTYVGEGVAIPHGTLAGKDVVHHDAICVLRFPDGVDWDGERVDVCVGIAAKGDGHVRLLSELAQILLDPDHARELREATETDAVLRLLQPTGEENT
ncbi:PTS sugar transporter subunit IIA [Nonomuraea sp. NPDC050404]|uniref:PTS sugar transporter subunit IIA n=1 Tax=Nonomuraea sp. NPDC050404 TaxID=3155783 RepID=UPI0033C72D1A